MISLSPSGWGRVAPPSPSYQIDWSHPLAEGMVLCLLPSLGIKWYDQSANANHGTLNGNPVWAGGPLGSVINFDGVNDYVDCGSNTSLSPGNGNFTFAAWVQSNNLNSFALSSRISAATAGFEILIGNAGSAGQWTVRAGDGIVNIGAPVASGLNDGGLHLVVGVIDRSAALLRQYIDGIQTSTVSLGAMGSITNATSTQIGARNAASFTAGLIGPVFCHNRALTAGEIVQLFSDPYGLIQSEPPARCILGPGGVLLATATMQSADDLTSTGVGVFSASTSLQGVGTTLADGVLAGSSSLIVTNVLVARDMVAETGQGDSIEITGSDDRIGLSGGRA